MIHTWEPKTDYLDQSAVAVEYTDCFSRNTGYDTKVSDVFPEMLELCGMWSTPLLTLLPVLQWPVVVARDRSLSIGQIEMFDI